MTINGDRQLVKRKTYEVEFIVTTFISQHHIHCYLSQGRFITGSNTPLEEIISDNSEIFVPILALVLLRAIDVSADEAGANWKVDK